MGEPAFVDQIIGRRVAERREQLGFSCREMADRTALSELEVEAYERGLRRFTSGQLLKFATALDCSAVSLLTDPPAQPPPASPPPLRLV